jgi:hypothetical protein
MKKKLLISPMLFAGALMFFGVEVSAHGADSEGVRYLFSEAAKQKKNDCNFKKNVSAVLCDLVSHEPKAGVTCRQIRSMIEGC